MCYIKVNFGIWEYYSEPDVEWYPWYVRPFISIYRFFRGKPEDPFAYCCEIVNSCVSDIKKNNISKVLIDFRDDGMVPTILEQSLFYAFGVDKYNDFTIETKKSELLRLTEEAEGRVSAESSEDYTNEVVKVHYLDEDIKSKITQRVKPKIYLAIDKFTGWNFATIAKDNKLFEVIGESTLRRPSNFINPLWLKLPNTKKLCYISCKDYHRPDLSKDDEETLMPDVLIYKTFNDMATGVDPVLDYVISK